MYLPSLQHLDALELEAVFTENNAILNNKLMALILV